MRRLLYPLSVFANILANVVIDRGGLVANAVIHSRFVGKAVLVIRADFLMVS